MKKTLVALALLAPLLAGCSSASPTPEAAAPAQASPTAAPGPTCGEYLAKPADEQRSLARGALKALATDGHSPRSVVTTQFAQNAVTVCQASSEIRVAEVMASLATLDAPPTGQNEYELE